jgi:hypothetical protein
MYKLSVVIEVRSDGRGGRSSPSDVSESGVMEPDEDGDGTGLLSIIQQDRILSRDGKVKPVRERENGRWRSGRSRRIGLGRPGWRRGDGSSRGSMSGSGGSQ